VLTVNHVFEILLNFSQCQSWAQAIERVVPQRKIYTAKPSSESSPANAEEDTAATDDGTNVGIEEEEEEVKVIEEEEVEEEEEEEDGV
jgi:hypothetical protein